RTSSAHWLASRRARSARRDAAPARHVSTNVGAADERSLPASIGSIGGGRGEPNPDASIDLPPRSIPPRTADWSDPTNHREYGLVSQESHHAAPAPVPGCQAGEA